MNEIIKNVYFDEFYLTVIRILKLIEIFGTKEKYVLTQKKIVFFDFYLRFPAAATEQVITEDFDDKYSFYHWKPDYALYDAALSLLYAKGLIEYASEEMNCYAITQRGKEVLQSLECEYMGQLTCAGNYIIKVVSKWSDKKIDEDIVAKSFCLRKAGDSDNGQILY